MKNKKGITLIALVITIIILLILAGVSIVALTGESGILQKANQATEEYKRNSAEEKIKLAILSYQVNKEETTLYDELRVIEGLTSIEPSDASEPPYIVIVDGYKFEIKKDLKIEYKNKEDKPIESIPTIPEITEIIYEKVQEVEKLPITIKAKTRNQNGLKQIIISYKREEGDQVKYEDIKREDVTEKEVTIEGEIQFNGTYVIQVIGQNGKITKEEIIINNIKEGGILATITKGNFLEGNQPTVNLIIRGEGQGSAIKEMQLYLNGEKVKTYKYEDLQSIREETYTIDDLAFYQNIECYVKVIGMNKEKDSEIMSVMNDRIIKTAVDLRNLATQVNKENSNTFQGKTIQVIEDIETGENWIPIGYYDGLRYLDRKVFCRYIRRK